MNTQTLLRLAKSSTATVLDNLWKWHPPICENVKEWARSQPDRTAQILHQDIVKASRIHRSPPKTVDATIHPLFLSQLSNQAAEKYLVQIHQAKLLGKHGVVVLPDGSYTAEPLMGSQSLQHQSDYYSYLRQQTYSHQRKAGKYYSLLQLNAAYGNYYHWMHDVLQKLYCILDRLPQETQFVVPNGLKAWQYEALATIGLNQDRLVIHPGREIWELETLYFSPPNTVWGWDLPGANEWVRSAFYKRFNLQAEALDRKKLILISRAKAKGRKITNESAVEALLRQYGFQTYFLETMSLQEQVQLFSEAKAIVAPHGAGLTNLMFAQPSTQVLEFFEPSKISSLCFWSMSNCLQQDYWCLFGETIKNSEYPQHPNIFVPIQTLEKTMQSFLESA
ncbi:glycosyltransferase family 61 protein [Phormidesmis sp. 146-35]